ncbi:hypothetical protein HHK36_005475 [Tetracentron sinense]|uniref:Uncharacterized protein n=1 Tax=Tetracentron sinense TaxID=13715 RepID=A0A835DQR2_TETSI|nr:hypothetical protein HHK36_005475 [Tetracentron sinense]
MTTRKRFCHLVSLLLFSFQNFDAATVTDSIKPGQSITSSQTIISAAGKFELGFFSPGSSTNYFMGIWYKKIPVRTVVWVANRDFPLTSPSRILTINKEGNLVILDGGTSYLVSELSSIKNSTTSATLLDSGNLVLIGSNSDVLWQSFDYPSDTYLSEMKLGNNKKTGKAWTLTSWRSEDDPAPGAFSMKMDPGNSPQLFIMQGSERYWTSGLWNGGTFTRVPETRLGYIYNFRYVTNQNESYFIFNLYDTIISRVFLGFSGQIKLQAWMENSQEWKLFWARPKPQCNAYASCGAFGSCSHDTLALCECMPGFEPQSSNDWNLSDWSGGCVRRTHLQCGINNSINAEKDRFLLRPKMRLPVMPQSLGVGSAEDCELACLNNCSCTAYAYGGGGCSIWIGDLLNLQQFSDDENAGSDLYLRLAASELSHSKGNKRKLWAIVTPVVALCSDHASLGDVGTGQDLLLFDMGICIEETKNGASNENKICEVKKDAELPLFSFASAWELWKGDRALELIDPMLCFPPSMTMMLRYINVGLLCVQENAADRPTMSDVVSMLSNELSPLPTPNQPPFLAERSVIEANSHMNRTGACSLNGVTISLMEAR